MPRNKHGKGRRIARVPLCHLPPGVDQHTLQAAIEADKTYQANASVLMRRARQGEITPDQVRSMHAWLVHRALYRHCIATGTPTALLGRMETIVNGR